MNCLQNFSTSKDCKKCSFLSYFINLTYAAFAHYAVSNFERRKCNFEDFVLPLRIDMPTGTSLSYVRYGRYLNSSFKFFFIIVFEKERKKKTQ